MIFLVRCRPDLFSGLLTCLNPFGWVLSFLSHITDFGNSGETLSFWKNWKGKCDKCFEGIFCANFSNSILDYASCQKVWHAQCYECLGLGTSCDLKFPIKEMKDENDNPWSWYKQQEKEYRINHGVAGAHLSLLMPFLCERCWMRILEKRSPQPGRDDTLVACIRRVNLDAMTGKSEYTIKGHLGRSRTKRILTFNSKYGNTPTFEPRGSLPPMDLVGMGVALDMMLYSLEAVGRNEDVVQYSTKLFGKIDQRPPETTTRLPMESHRDGMFFCGKKRQSKTNERCPTQSGFFSHYSAKVASTEWDPSLKQTKRCPSG